MMLPDYLNMKVENEGKIYLKYSLVKSTGLNSFTHIYFMRYWRVYNTQTLLFVHFCAVYLSPNVMTVLLSNLLNLKNFTLGKVTKMSWKKGGADLVD